MSDMFHHKVPDQHICTKIAVMVAAHQHTHLLLTKRAERAADFLLDLHNQSRIYFDIQRLEGEAPPVYDWPPKNIHIGFSAGTQEAFDDRWADMRRLADDGWTVFVSMEPLLESVTLPDSFLAFGSRVGVITGGESGPKARPADLQWFRDIRDQCIISRIPFFMKQILLNRSKIPYEYWPHDLQIREVVT